MKQLILVIALIGQSSAFAGAASGEHLVYTVGCVNCHHQTPKEIISAPPLIIVKSYSFVEFKKLMRTGVTRTGRDMLAQSSVMGIVAKEQFSHFTDNEIADVYSFLTKEWTVERGMIEEKKIPTLFKALIAKGKVHL